MAEHRRIVDALTIPSGTPGGEAGITACTHLCEDAMLILKVALKCADLGHPTLSYALLVRRARRLEKELFRQGDLQKARLAAEGSFFSLTVANQAASKS